MASTSRISNDNCSNPMKPNPVLKQSKKQNVTSSDYPPSVLQQLQDMRQSSLFCDVELICEETSIRAQRIILSAASPYFKAMFTGGLAEAQQSQVVIKGVSPATLSMAVDFVYSGQVALTQDNVEELIVAANMLQLVHLERLCATFIYDEVDETNAFGIHVFASMHNSEYLESSVYNYICLHFSLVCQNDEFLEMPKDVISKFLCSEKLKINSESEVLSAVIRWIEGSTKQRLCYLSDLLKEVRVSLIPYRLLKKAVDSCKDESIKAALQVIFDEVYKGTCDIVKPDAQHRKMAVRTVYAIGGWQKDINDFDRSEAFGRYSDDDSSEDQWFSEGDSYDIDYSVESCLVERLCPLNKKWVEMPPLPAGREAPGYAALRGDIYVVGGRVEGQASGSTLVSKTGDYKGWWHDIANLQVPRYDLGLCELNGSLYAFGGCDRENVLQSIEKYNPVTKQWSVIGQMPKARRSMRVVSHKGLIYVISGWGRKEDVFSKDFVSYNPTTGEWHKLAPWRRPRGDVAVAVMDDHLYVVGGYSLKGSNSVDRYSFERNKWMPVAQFSDDPLTQTAAFVADGSLYVIGGETFGGWSQDRQVTRGVRRYIRKKNVWDKYVCDMPHLSCARSGIGVVVL